MYDDYGFEEEGRYNYRPPPVHPGANTGSGPWAPGYDPGPNWNGGQAPASSDPYQNYNGGSPVNAPLQAGHGWEWTGPQDPIWNMGTNNWDRGSWNQVQGRGIGYQAPAATPPPPNPGPPGPQPTTRDGSVKSLPAVNIPSSTLPGDVQAQFTTTPTKTPVQSAYQTALLKYLDQSQQTPSLDDPILGPQAEVYRVQQQRNQERNRRGAVERAAASGLNSSGAVDRKIEQGIQEQRFNTAQYNANLLGRELERRRNELLSALQLASATGDAESQRELQARLAQVSAMMQQQGLNLQGQLGFGDLALRAMLGDMSNNQFYDALGVNTALGMEGLNQRALEIAMRER